jgi:peptidoglycan/xylan/chitin deacetylase (PgdA/CDA1 family)
MIRRGQCVLVLHRVVHARRAVHDVSWRSFLGLLDLIDAVAAPISRELRPVDSVALTFDDGTEDHVLVAEELARRGLAATFFVPGAAPGRTGRLDIEGVRRLVALGHEVGAHGLRHEPLAALTADAVREELACSKERLEHLLDRPVRLFAPPGGSSHPALVPTLRANGFTASRSTRWGIFTSAESRWAIPSIPVTEVTLGCGWVAEALEKRAMPTAMRAAWLFKEAAPQRLAHATRAVVHRAR